MKRLAPILLTALVIAGCGGHPARHTAPVAPVAQPATVALAPPGHPCDAADLVMQCRAAAPTVGLRALPALLPAKAFGVDFGWGDVRPSAARALGAQFAASYLSYDTSKNWTRSLVDAYHAAGLKTVAVWETTATRALGGYAAGQSDARAAARQAAALGMPSSRPIYFAVDFDSTGYGCAICGYFRGADSVLSTSRVGAGYGGLATVRTLANNHLAAYFWQTSAWSGGVWDGRAQIEQYGYTNSFDRDRATATDYGQWPYSAPRPPDPRKELRALRVYRGKLRVLLQTRGCRRRVAHHVRLGPKCTVWFAHGDRANARIHALGGR